MNNPRSNNYRECQDCHFSIVAQVRIFRGMELCQECYDGKMVKQEIKEEDSKERKWKIKGE